MEEPRELRGKSTHRPMTSTCLLHTPIRAILLHTRSGLPAGRWRRVACTRRIGEPTLGRCHTLVEWAAWAAKTKEEEISSSHGHRVPISYPHPTFVSRDRSAMILLASASPAFLGSCHLVPYTAPPFSTNRSSPRMKSEAASTSYRRTGGFGKRSANPSGFMCRRRTSRQPRASRLSSVRSCMLALCDAIRSRINSWRAEDRQLASRPSARLWRLGFCSQ